MAQTFSALVLDEADGKVSATIKALSDDDLPEGDVTVRVCYSTLNYKDGLVLNGLGRLVRKYPHIPGIDFSGIVEDSRNPAYRVGDKVILTGWRVGEMHWGGYAQRARVKAEWLVPLPRGMDLKRAMAIGTAGFTAMLAALALEENGLIPGTEAEVCVTGAAGGLGSVAVAILAAWGYRVAAVTGRAGEHDYLRALGAATILDRAELAAPAKPLLAERWAGAIDAVGAPTLPALLAGTRYGGPVAACGNAGGVEFAANILPFILRGIKLLGIDSVMCPFERRKFAWEKLASDLPDGLLDGMTSLVKLSDIPRLGRDILKGQVKGRVVVDLETG